MPLTRKSGLPMTTETTTPASGENLNLSGTVISGTRAAAFFTQLEWVQSQCSAKLGFTPYPGTLNLELAESDRELTRTIPALPGVPLVPPDGAFCESRVYRASIGTIPCAIIFPEESVRVHGAGTIEILAPVCLRETLKVKDGDQVHLAVWTGTRMVARAVLFDLDGTLIDSTGVYFKMVELVMTQLDLPEASREDVIAAAENDPFDWLRIIPKSHHHQQDTLIPSAWRIVEAAYPALFREEVSLMGGAVEIMKQLVIQGIKIGIVTSTPRKYIHYKMRLFKTPDIADLITTVITADDAPRKKPAPDPLIRCAQLLEIPASECIYIGDTRMDIRAGKAAGMKTIAVASGFDLPEVLAAENPDALIDSVGNLSRILPFF